MIVKSQNAMANPANVSDKRKAEPTRIPMSVPVLKLAVPEIPGYHLHWMRGDAARLQQALRAGYTFVGEDEVEVANTGLADDVGKSGNTDLGSRLSLSAGSDLGRDGQPERLYLMKLPNELWEQDQKALADKQERVAEVMRGSAGTVEGGYTPKDHQQAVNSMFSKKS